MSGYTAYRTPNPHDWQWQKDATGQDIAFLIYQDQARYWRWSAKAANNEKLANGGEGYVNRADCVASARRLGFRGV